MGRSKREAIEINAKSGLVGSTLWQDYMSVTTTENFIMAAARAKGKSVMINAASEPHVQDLCNFLNQMGAKISGIGSSTLTIEGVENYMVQHLQSLQTIMKLQLFLH